MVPPQLNGALQRRKYYRTVVKKLRPYRQNGVQILTLSLGSSVILVKITLTALSLFSFFIYKTGVPGMRVYKGDNAGKVLKRVPGTELNISCY